LPKIVARIARASHESDSPFSAKQAEMININKATAVEIDGVQALRGHGYEITRYRQERGGFTDLRQLDEVPGLAGKTEGIEQFVSVTD
jgi:competence protein ComEA